MTKFKKGDRVRITAGPREGDVGHVHILAVNGAIVTFIDESGIAVRDDHLEAID